MVFPLPLTGSSQMARGPITSIDVVDYLVFFFLLDIGIFTCLSTTYHYCISLPKERERERLD